jgi:hypothetical protein
MGSEEKEWEDYSPEIVKEESCPCDQEMKGKSLGYTSVSAKNSSLPSAFWRHL